MNFKKWFIQEIVKHAYSEEEIKIVESFRRKVKKCGTCDNPGIADRKFVDIFQQKCKFCKKNLSCKTCRYIHHCGNRSFETILCKKCKEEKIVCEKCDQCVKCSIITSEHVETCCKTCGTLFCSGTEYCYKCNTCINQ
jgi:hypothetical protein